MIQKHWLAIPAIAGIALGSQLAQNHLLAHSADGGHSPISESAHHSTVEIPKGQPVPSVNLVVHPDPMDGWNLEVKVANFRFAPERISQKGSLTEGHAHLFVNGRKVTRLYGTWYYLALEPGQHKITVSLNTNQHQSLTHNGQPILDTTIVTVPQR
ncbi:hypothetical protein H6F43_12055 [Leptolyngbya sp. FACHB-36]|uniref:hypothetical protein n=1 Tax=Leptolyngbya sp. FACHB-36 TaxID=2692808 RepID=UPI001681860A|nr:hypothetical protein [Leptolyngbya sp. FACHB-36]MBD2020912.1 hypothetical protein [Leptolyngbya sp. FACHB-36]